MEPADRSGRVRAAAAVVLVAAAWILAAGRVSIWFDLDVDGFGTTGFASPGGTTGAVLEAACVLVMVLAIIVAVRPNGRRPTVLAGTALLLSAAGLREWWSEATVDADFPAGTLRETPVEVFVSPSMAGFFVLAAVVALQGAAVVLLPRRPVVVGIGVLFVVTVAVAVLAPDQLSTGSDGVTVIR